MVGRASRRRCNGRTEHPSSQKKFHRNPEPPPDSRSLSHLAASIPARMIKERGLFRSHESLTPATSQTRARQRRYEIMMRGIAS